MRSPSPEKLPTTSAEALLLKSTRRLKSRLRTGESGSVRSLWNENVSSRVTSISCGKRRHFRLQIERMSSALLRIRNYGTRHQYVVHPPPLALLLSNWEDLCS